MSQQYKSREERRKALASKKKKPKKKGIARKIVFFILLLGLVGIIGGTSTFAYFAATAPPLNDDLLKGNMSSKVYDKDGNEIGEVGSEKRTYVKIDEIPQVVKDAFIATEDVRFYKHNGIDPIRIGGAVIANFKEGFGSEGASTITQQLVKLSFLSLDKTVKRKAQEAWLALQVEQKYSKDEILEMYLNRIYYPGNYYGVARATEAFFGKDLKDITLSEAAMLAGMIKNPDLYNPRKNPDLAEKRRNVVLNLMVKNGFISEEEAAKAKQTSITESLVEPKKQQNKYHAFIEHAIEEVRKKLGVDPSSAGLKIYTTIDTDAQEYVEQLLNGDEISYPSKYFQAGIALIDTTTGEIRAIGGGRNQPIGGFNYAVDLKRQPGSTIKPILDYGPAIEHLKWSTYHQIVDEPYTYSNGKPINNYDRSYKGQMSIREALADSRNIPALKAFQEVGESRAKAFAEKLGIKIDKITEAYAIGGFEHGISPLQLAGAYSAFGNNGIYNEPYSVTKVVFVDGTKADLTPDPVEAMSDYTAFMITDMLKTVVERGTGTRARVPGLNIAGKTGSTNFTEQEKAKYHPERGAAKDNWFVGYTPKYTAAVWTGYEKNEEKMYITKREQQIARDIFRKLMRHVSDGDSSDFKQPKSVVKKAIEKGSNPAKLASKYTPKNMITYEYFVRGEEPTKVSTKYEKLDKPSGLTINYDQKTNAVKLSWNHSESDVSFEVSASIDNAASKVLTTTKDKSYVLSNVKPGSVYKFSVTAVRDSMRSDPASAMIEIPSVEEEEQEELPDELTPPEQEQNEGQDEEDQLENENDNEQNNGQNEEENQNENPEQPQTPNDSTQNGNQGGGPTPPQDPSNNFNRSQTGGNGSSQTETPAVQQ